MAETTISTAELNILLLEGARSGNLKLVKEVLEAGANILQKEHNEEGFTALHLAAMNGHNLVVKVLLDRGAPVDIKSNLDKAPLHLATKFNKNTVVGTLLRKGADVKATTAAKETVVHKAAFAGDEEILSQVLTAGADPTLADEGGNLPLHLFARSGDVDCGEILLKRLAGSGINQENNIGLTPLHEATIYGQYDFLKLLLNQPGINVNVTASTTGNTPLHDAAARSSADMAKIIPALLKAGADKSIKNKDGKSAVEIATPENVALFA